VSNIVIKCTEPVPGSYTPVCLLSSILCLPSSILCHLSSMLCLLSSMPFLVSSTLYSKSSILCRLSFILGLSSSRLWFLSTILCLMFYMICFNSSIHCLLSFTTFLLSSIVCNGRWNERSGRLSFGGLKNGLRSWTESQGPLGPRDSVQLQRPFWTPPNDRRPQFSFQRPAYCYICDCHKSSEVRQEKRSMAASFDVCRKYNSMYWLYVLCNDWASCVVTVRNYITPCVYIVYGVRGASPPHTSTSILFPLLTSFTCPGTTSCPAAPPVLNWKVTECVPKFASNWVLILTRGGFPVAFCTTRNSLVTISITCPVWNTKSPFRLTASEERQLGMLAWDRNSRVGELGLTWNTAISS